MDKSNKTILFLPFLQIPSGHHQVADALIERLQARNSNMQCTKIDPLSYSYGKIESLISSIYLKWIQTMPGSYNLVYQANVYKNLNKNKRYLLYELLFHFFIKKLLVDKKPDFVICTHALPSYILNCLKEKGKINTPVINVYTDYFIHSLWGMKHIDFHFVPSQRMFEFLTQKGVKSDQIYITGIPIHEKISKTGVASSQTNNSTLSLLIAGGNMGIGTIESLVKRFKKTPNIQLHVLCGKNENLYHKLVNLKQSNITPLQYITCRKTMNDLYNRVDAVLTKPGGVTISECLFKRKPVFVYHALPGQETINLDELMKLGIVFNLRSIPEEQLVDHIVSILSYGEPLREMHRRISQYHQYICDKEPCEIIEELSTNAEHG